MTDLVEPGFTTVTNEQGASFTVSRFGARLVDVRMPDRDGRLGSCMLGFDTEEEYATHVGTYIGATVGRVAGRSAGARFVGGGLDLKLTANDNGHTLHGGPGHSLDGAIWKAEPVTDDRGRGLRFSMTSPDGSEGYPGDLRVTSTYLLNDHNELTFDMTAVSDVDTPVALTQHSYWNLSSGGRDTVTADSLWIASDRLVGMTSELVPTGSILSVKNTGFDFTELRPLEQQLPEHTGVPWPGIDHTYLLNERADWRVDAVASLVSNSTGRRMDVFTTEPALQIYLGCHLNGIPGRDGATYGAGDSICLETVRLPDSPLLPMLPSVVLPAGTEYRHQTVHRFTADASQ
jgi:aldose 1-epimerase